MRLEAQAGGALVAERPARDAAGECAQQHREVVHAVCEQAVCEMAGNRAEGGAPCGSDQRKGEHGRGRSPRQVLRVLLDDGRIRFGHASPSSAAGPPVLRGNWPS